MSDENDAATAATDVESRAKRMGWRPKEEFRGPEDRWRTAEEYVAKAEDDLPLMRERLRFYDDQVKGRDQTIETLKGEVSGVKKALDETQQVLTEFRDFASKGEERAYKRAKAELEAKRDDAVKSADTEAFNKAQAELDELNANAPKAPAVKETTKTEETTKPPERKEAPTFDPVVTAWVSENKWFETDPMLNQVAQAIHVGLQQTNKDLTLKQNLEETAKEIKRRFPEKFENTRRAAASTVLTPDGGGGDRPGRKKGKTYEDLPAEGKAACDRFVRTIKGYTREQYLKDYDWGDDQ